MMRCRPPVLYLCIITMLCALFSNQSAFAKDLPEFVDPTNGKMNISSVQDCAAGSGFEEYQVTSRVVYCIRNVILYSVGVLMQQISFYMSGTIAIAFAFACAMLGVRILGGEPQLLPKLAGTIIRWGLALWFFQNLSAIAYFMFGIIDWMIALVTPPNWVPWEQVDELLGRLFGFGENIDLANGMAGIVFAAMFSSTSGGSLFAIAAGAVYGLMRFVLEIIYVYLIALLIVGFLLVLAPFIVPLTLFRFTERYFTKWLKNIIGAMLLPVMLYAFLSMSLQYFDNLLQNTLDSMSQQIYDARGNPSFESFWSAQQPNYSWIAPGDPNNAKKQQARIGAFSQSYGNRQPKIKPPMASEHNPYNQFGQEMSTFSNFRVSYDSLQFRQIIFSVIAFFIYVNMMLSLVKAMPMVARSIASSAFYSTEGRGTGINIKTAIADAGAGAGFILGGWAGSQAGDAAGKGRARSLGALGGAIAGAAAGRQAGNYLTTQLSSLVGKR